MTKQEAINKAKSYRTFIQLTVLGMKANPQLTSVGEVMEKSFEETLGEKLVNIEE